MARVVVADERTVAAIAAAYSALVSVKSGRKRKMPPLPKWTPDGSPVASCKQLAAIMGVSEQGAAAFVLEAKDASPELVADAKTVVMGMPGLKPKPKRAGMIRRPKPSLRKRGIIRHAGHACARKRS